MRRKTHAFLHISKENVLIVIGAMLRAADMENVQLYRQNGMACYDVDLEAEAEAHSSSQAGMPKDPTGAERQRRHRNKHRNGYGRDVMVELDALPLLTNRHAQEDLQAAE